MTEEATKLPLMPAAPLRTPDAPDDSAKAMARVLTILKPLDEDTQKRVITAASILLGLKLT